MTLKTLGMGIVKKILTKSKKTSDVNLEKIYDKFYDKSGKMKQKGKDIVTKGLKGLK